MDDFISEINSEQYLIKSKIPVLVLNGSFDLQITPEENLKAIKMR